MNKRQPHSRRDRTLMIIEMHPEFKKRVAARARELDLSIRQYVTRALDRDLQKAKAA